MASVCVEWHIPGSKDFRLYGTQGSLYYKNNAISEEPAEKNRLYTIRNPCSIGAERFCSRGLVL